MDNFLNSSTSIYILLFFILFTVITLVLSRVNLFRGQYGQPNAFAAGVVSFSISAIAIYYLYQSGFQGESLLSWLGFSGEGLGIFVLVLVALVVILMIWKLGAKGFFLFGGAALILTAMFTDIIYEKGWAWVIGFVFLVIGLWLWQRTSRYISNAGNWAGNRALTGAKKQPRWAMVIIGLLLSIGGFAIGFMWMAIVGIIIFLIGFGWGTYRQSRIRGYGGTYEAALREDQQRAHEEALGIQNQIEHIEAQIRNIERDIRRYQRARPRSPAEAATIRAAIINLDNERRALLNEIRRITHS